MPRAHSKTRGPIVLTTDFGLEDGYVGTMKGVVLGINPRVAVVDLSHQVPAQDVAEAAFLLWAAYRYFPPRSIHVVVVDPGVGSERRAIAVETPEAAFVAPDNGVLSWVLRDRGLVASAPGRWPIPRGASVRAVALTNPRYRLPEVSETFHGRDVFAPAAAHLSRGVPLDDLGEPVGDLYLLPAPTPIWRDGELVGQVVHVDHFGNLVTSLRPAELAGLRPVQLVIRGHVVRGLRRFYAEGAGLGAVIGSAGLIELALTGGSAAAALGASVGDEVIARRGERTGCAG